MSIRTKIYLAAVLWLGLCGAMFLYGFKILDQSNRAALAQISKQKNQLLALQAEDKNYQLALQDLNDMKAKSLQPIDFFSQDITLVKEIEVFENLGNVRGVSLTLGGISGTIGSVPKAPTKSPLYLIPVSISINGSFSKVVDTVENLENLDFAVSLNSLNLTGAGGTVNAAISATLYIRSH